jgi:hypothetical protein
MWKPWTHTIRSVTVRERRVAAMHLMHLMSHARALLIKKGAPPFLRGATQDGQSHAGLTALDVRGVALDGVTLTGSEKLNCRIAFVVGRQFGCGKQCAHSVQPGGAVG